MIIPFNKYQGAGNDFVITDNRKGLVDPADHDLIRHLCDRRFGIGADGLMLISGKPGFDYEMKYFNSDGFEGSMCGNGGRCSAAFAIKEGIAGKKMTFLATDGSHHAYEENGLIHLSMSDVKDPLIIDGSYFINTGSPHYVIFRDNIDQADVNTEGRKIRWSDAFAPGGTNVNFVEVEEGGIYVRTFERGVEEETLSCGTGVTASAIVTALARQSDMNTIPVRTRGGMLSVSFKVSGNLITDIWLTGPATFVFSGEISV